MTWVSISRAFARFHLLGLVLVVVGAGALPARAAVAGEVQTIWRLLDYVAVDYAGAVANRRVISPAEYSEMTEFSATIGKGIGTLPADPERAGLLNEAAKLQRSISAKAAPEVVAKQARALASHLLSVYPVPLAPTIAPDARRGAALYAQNCASCHGPKGDGRGPMAVGLDPPPIDFTETERARKRSLFALYQVIDQGLEGTAMPSFAALPAEDRWALAAHTGSFAFKEAAEGRRIWDSDKGGRDRFPDLAALTSVTPEGLGNEIGQAKADAVVAYLRANPQAVLNGAPTSLSIARARLAESVAAYRAGNRAAAEKLALSAYLDGFEPIEPILRTRDAALMTRVEAAMSDFRVAIGRGRPADDIARQATVIESLFVEADRTLSPDAASDASTFIGAFAILLREGLEALLVVVAMIAFLRKADRPELLPYVHGGWVTALIFGGATWAVATYAISVSGASRELTEGFGALFAAVVLVWVGIWMHGKSNAAIWQRYIRDALGKELSKRSSWFLFGLAFLIVYREAFETILFFAALAAQGSSTALAAGAFAALILLAVIAWIMLRYSRTLPIGRFFAYSSVLMAVLAVILAGKGVGALQEAGLIDVTPVTNVPKLTMFGIYPSLQPLLLQAVAVGALVIGFRFNNRIKSPPAVAVDERFLRNARGPSPDPF